MVIALRDVCQFSGIHWERRAVLVPRHLHVRHLQVRSWLLWPVLRVWCREPQLPWRPRGWLPAWQHHHHSLQQQGRLHLRKVRVLPERKPRGNRVRCAFNHVPFKLMNENFDSWVFLKREKWWKASNSRTKSSVRTYEVEISKVFGGSQLEQDPKVFLMHLLFTNSKRQITTIHECANQKT